jgi:flagellar biosynthetic protein FliQ
MTPETIMNLAYQGMRVTLMLAGPALLAALLIGLLVSLFQAATQINEMTLSFIPKILGVFAVLVLTGPMLIELITDFTAELLRNIPALVNGLPPAASP